MTHEWANNDKSLLKVIAEGLPRTKRSCSSGGAVAIQAAARSPAVRTVLTLATQRYQMEQVAQLVPRCSILLPHDTANEVLPAECSQYTHRRTSELKRLILYAGAGHGFDEVVAAVQQPIRQ